MIYVLRLHDFMRCHNEMWQNAPSTCFSIRLTYQSAAEQKREERRKQALAPQINCKTLISAIRSPDSLFVMVVYLGYWYVLCANRLYTTHLRAFFAACINGSKWFVDKTGTRSAFCARSHHHLQQHQRHEYATLSRYNFHAARQSKDELEARWKIWQFGGGFQYQVLNSVSWCKPKP